GPVGRGGGCIMKEVGGVLPGDFTQKFIDSVPGAAYLKFTLRANGNSVPPEQILDPDEERVVKVVAGQKKKEESLTHFKKPQAPCEKSTCKIPAVEVVYLVTLHTYSRLCWVFTVVRREQMSFSSCGDKLSCPMACGIFPDQGLNLCPLHWQDIEKYAEYSAKIAFDFNFWSHLLIQRNYQQVEFVALILNLVAVFIIIQDSSLLFSGCKSITFELRY
ncbi:hypothetical protein MJG53_002900, partial [Ovis ammon polii x Ovis aries]